MSDAQGAVKDFLNHRFPPDKVSIITTDSRGEFMRQPVQSEPGNNAGTGAATGAVSGAVVGGIFGLLVGVGVLLIPGVGLFAAGPVVAALAGAGVGAVGGGILGALIGLGIPKDQVATYAEAIRRGGCLVAVEVNELDLSRANDILKGHHAVDVHQRSAYYHSQGFTNYDPSAPAYTPDQITEERARLRAMNTNAPPVSYPSDVAQTRYNAIPSNHGLTYQQWEPAYQFGWQLAQNPQFTSYTQSENTFRQMWEQSNPGTYATYRDAISAGYNDAFARRSGATVL